MEIIRNLNDLNYSDETKEFMAYLRESVDSYNVVDKIRNREYIKKYVQRKNDLPVYNYAKPGAEASRLIQNQ